MNTPAWIFLVAIMLEIAVMLGRCRAHCSQCNRCVDGRNVSLDPGKPLCIYCHEFKRRRQLDLRQARQDGLV